LDIGQNIFKLLKDTRENLPIYYPTSPANVALTFQIIENTSKKQETDWLDE
jgi:hypothetical protein